MDLAGNYPGFPSVGATLALDAGGVAIASTAITTTSKLASGVFDTYSTGLMLPNQSLVGTPLTVTITPGSTGSYSQDSLAGVGVDNVRILQYNFIPGDANGDGKVDINDLTIVLGHYNQQGMTWTEGDFTGDGAVNINDLTIVLANYNTTATYGGPAAVPETGRRRDVDCRADGSSSRPAAYRLWCVSRTLQRSTTSGSCAKICRRGH